VADVVIEKGETAGKSAALPPCARSCAAEAPLRSIDVAWCVRTICDACYCRMKSRLGKREIRRTKNLNCLVSNWHKDSFQAQQRPKHTARNADFAREKPARLLEIKMCALVKSEFSCAPLSIGL
jgi:transposase-like protein